LLSYIQGAINPFWRDFQHSIEQSFNFTQHVVVTGDLNVDLMHEKNHVLNFDFDEKIISLTMNFVIFIS
jgi:hypothetical protein